MTRVSPAPAEPPQMMGLLREWRQQKVVANLAFSNPSEDALLLVRFEIFNGVYNCTDCLEIVFGRAHTYTVLVLLNENTRICFGNERCGAI